jgi:hypothetical protein
MLDANFSEYLGKIGSGGVCAAAKQRFGGCYGGFTESAGNNKMVYTGLVTLSLYRAYL